jgi:hypothetical protein
MEMLLATASYSVPRCCLHQSQPRSSEMGGMDF